MPLGSRLREALMAACTSRAAPLMSRSRSNCTMIRVEPWLVRLVIWLMPAMVPSERSSGVVTLDAMISGLAPGRLACTVITGKSICGSGDTGSRPKLTLPSSRIARLSSMVATGRWMNGAERFMGGGSKLQASSCKRPRARSEAEAVLLFSCSLWLVACRWRPSHLHPRG
ncbi:hypothetical protein D9M71_615460 [compost metagenome]